MDDFNKTKQAAEQGDAAAQYNLAVMYRKAVPQDFAEAEKWFRKAAQQGLVGAQSELDEMHDWDCTESDYDDKTIALLKKAAEEEDPEAWYRLGRMYELLEHNLTKAIKWLGKSAAQCYPEAEYRLGILYAEGNSYEQELIYELFGEELFGHSDRNVPLYWFLKAAEGGYAKAQHHVACLYGGEWEDIEYLAGHAEQDKEEAVKWFRAAAEQGYPCCLGSRFYNGEGVVQNKFESAKWYRRDAEQGDASAQRILGSMYLNGDGVQPDKGEAAKWLRKAAEQGDSVSQCTLGLMHLKGNGVPQDINEAVKLLRKAAEQGDVDAQWALGTIYEKGGDVPQDLAEAVKWYHRVAEQGDVGAQKYLGDMYREGKGVVQDSTKAFEWYLVAAEQGYNEAQFELGKMYTEGEGSDKNLWEGYVWLLVSDLAHPDFMGQIERELSSADIIAARMEAEQRAPEVPPEGI